MLRRHCIHQIVYAASLFTNRMLLLGVFGVAIALPMCSGKCWLTILFEQGIGKQWKNEIHSILAMYCVRLLFLKFQH